MVGAEIPELSKRRQWGWAGTVQEFLGTPGSTVMSSIADHHADLMRQRPSKSQVDAWRDEIRILRSTLRDITVAAPHAVDWSIVLEYELPLEGGRRPDVILFAGRTMMVLEFKGDLRLEPAFVDQVMAYSRDLNEYHAASHRLRAVPVLVLTRATGPVPDDRATSVDPASLASVLLETESIAWGSLDP